MANFKKLSLNQFACLKQMTYFDGRRKHGKLLLQKFAPTQKDVQAAYKDVPVSVLLSPCGTGTLTMADQSQSLPV